jgi:NADPH:quinone reductase-like Zn-dependent oxidoreductase
MAIQVAKELGARVAVTVGGPEKAEVCRQLGADLVINYKEQDFVEVLKTEEAQPDVVLDIIGAKYLEKNVDVLGTNGRLVVIGLQGGTKAEIDLGALLAKRASVSATALRARPPAEKAAIVAATVENVWPMIEAGAVRPTIHTTFPLDEVGAAHQVLEDSSNVGKVLLTTSAS